MKNLQVEIEVLDYDLETIGFDFNVLSPDTKKAKSKSHVRMSLVELNVFIDALKASAANINLAAPKSITGNSRTDRSPKLSSNKLFPGDDLMKKEIAEEVTKVAKR